MVMKEYGREDWQIFRKEILELVMLYSQLKEYANFNRNMIKQIESFFYLSHNNTIASFFIKFGFILDDGTPTLRNFLSKEDIDELRQSYEPKIKRRRDKFYAHNNKSSLASLNISTDEIDELYNKIISKCEKIDLMYNEPYQYSRVHGAEGIQSIEYLIENSNKFFDLQEKLIANDFEATVKLDIQSGEVLIKTEN